MAGNKTKNDSQETSKASSREDYEVQYLVIKYKLSPQRARELVSKHGGNWQTIKAELETLKFGE